MARNFSRRWRRTVSRSRPASSSSAWAIASPVEAMAAAGPEGGGAAGGLTGRPQVRASAGVHLQRPSRVGAPRGPRYYDFVCGGVLGRAPLPGPEDADAPAGEGADPPDDRHIVAELAV